MSFAFNWLDYSIVIIYVLGILAFGAFFIKKQNSLTDFFMASRKMHWLPVGCSILATSLSAVSLIGVPAEFWQNGLRCSWVTFLPFLTAPIVIVFFVRLYCSMKIITAYEYLERRFSLSVRLLASLVFMLLRGCYIGIVLYASATLLYPIFNNDIHMVWLIIGMGLCAGLLAIAGGMAAVIWTDVIQLMVIYGGLICICCAMIGHIENGLLGMFRICVEHGKDFSFFKESSYWSPSLFAQTTFWGLFIGESFYLLATNGTDQMSVQRYLSTASTRDSAKSIWAYAFVSLPAVFLIWFTGAGLFAFYIGNPHLLDSSITPDGLLPYYIVTQLPHGLSGVIVAGILSAILSTVDSGLNCLATASANDFHFRLFRKRSSDIKNVAIARLWTGVWTIITVCLSIVIYYFTRENLFRTIYSILGLFSGVLLAIFLLGIITHRANTKGVLIGAIIGFIIVLWANYGWTKVGQNGEEIHISPFWPAVIGTISTFVLGFAASLFFSPPPKEDLAGLIYKKSSG